MNLDWRRLKAVVLQSDDWGFCGWSPDAHAWRVLADTPVFRSPAGQRYGGSTLESASDVRALADILLPLRGGDGFPPVLQANTIVAAPDYSRLEPPAFPAESLPLVAVGETPTRWARPGLWDEVARACEAGLWWPELHGLHHLPEAAWLAALRRGDNDARRAFEHQSPICAAVDASGEYDPSEPEPVRARSLALAVERFTALIGRAPASLCPPDYRWDRWLEREAGARGIRVLQGKGEQAGVALPRAWRLWHRYRWPQYAGECLAMPPRVAFEPLAAGPSARRLGVDAAHRGVRHAWALGQPAALSSHRANYAHLEPERAAQGRAVLRTLLERLVTDGAVFLTDAEARDLQERGWSARPIGTRGVLLRHYGVPRDPVRIAVPADTSAVCVREGGAPGDAQVELDGATAVARLNVGEYLLEWQRS